MELLALFFTIIGLAYTIYKDLANKKRVPEANKIHRSLFHRKETTRLPKNLLKDLTSIGMPKVKGKFKIYFLGFLCFVLVLVAFKILIRHPQSPP